MQPYQPGMTKSMGRLEALFYVSTSARSLKAMTITALLIMLVLHLLQDKQAPDWLLAMFTLVFGSLFDNGDTKIDSPDKSLD